ncbi:MAG: hypothetical protein RIA09_01530 [Hoeflea sp.]|uniref:hypothetical protein n=1 Tax=Hoeflea sp. TaxID=1940281 RepID=UPI0032ED5A12
MTHQATNDEVQKILKDDNTSTEQKIDTLESMRDARRAEMRAATESPMVADDDVGDDLKIIDRALADLHAGTVSIEDSGAATL